MTQIPARSAKHAKLQRERIKKLKGDYVALTPDFPFDYNAYLKGNGVNPLGSVDPDPSGTRFVAIIGAGVAGMIVAYEAMRMGLVPIIFEANDRLGGRFFSKRFEEENNSDKMPIAELGAMRFSQYSKSLVHYFEKVGMWSNTAPFPNPGTGWVPGNLVDYRGEQNYYVADPETGEVVPPTVNNFAYLSDQFYGDGTADSGLMERNGLQVSQAWNWQMTEDDGTIPETSKVELRDHWRNLLRGIGTKNNQSFDTKSFRDLFTDDGWSFEDIEAFGQIGFGTGGWGSDYIDSSVEVLRVIYMGLDTDQRLMLDGTDALVSRLYSMAPIEFGDNSVKNLIIDPYKSVESFQTGHADGSIFNKEVIGFSSQPGDKIMVHYRDASGVEHMFPDPFAAVVYTPHVRVLDKMRYQNDNLALQQETYKWFDAETWEAIMYTHYQQSTKVFQVVDEPFWNNMDTVTGEYEMSQTLSDKLSRGTYLVDYSANSTEGGNKGAGVFTSYTWADDSAKYLSTDNDKEYSSWINMSTRCLDEIYNQRYSDVQDVFRGHANGQPSAGKKWDDDPHFIMAFKYNLPGQYRYQKSLFQNFFCAPGESVPDTRNFILAGDGISWTAAWAEGAVQTALNAVAKLEYLFNGNVSNLASPHGQYLEWEPIDIPDPTAD